MLYVNPAPSGAVTVIVPVATAQVGCAVTPAVGATGVGGGLSLSGGTGNGGSAGGAVSVFGGFGTSGNGGALTLAGGTVFSDSTTGGTIEF